MAKFKQGDKVVRCERERQSNWTSAVSDPAGVFTITNVNSFTLALDGVRDWWDTDNFNLYVEPQPEPVAVTESSVQQIPGVPDGYRLVRIGAPKKGEQYITAYDAVCTADANLYDYTWAIVEPIVPPAPPTPIPSTVKVQLNRYLVGDLLGDHSHLGTRIVECTQDYMDSHYTKYRLLGPSETFELEVEV